MPLPELYNLMLAQVQDYMELIREQILSSIKCIVRKPSRSLSAGALKEMRDLVPFERNKNAYISIYNLILDNYIRVRFAFQALDEVWLYLLERCYPQMEVI